MNRIEINKSFSSLFPLSSPPPLSFFFMEGGGARRERPRLNPRMHAIQVKAECYTVIFFLYLRLDNTL